MGRSPKRRWKRRARIPCAEEHTTRPGWHAIYADDSSTAYSENLILCGVRRTNHAHIWIATAEWAPGKSSDDPILG